MKLGDEPVLTDESFQSCIVFVEGLASLDVAGKHPSGRPYNPVLFFSHVVIVFHLNYWLLVIAWALVYCRLYHLLDYQVRGDVTPIHCYGKQKSKRT